MGALLASITVTVTAVINRGQRGSTPVVPCIWGTSGKLGRVPLDPTPERLRRSSWRGFRGSWEYWRE